MIILTGANDANPNELFANLYCSVQKLSHTNVILSQVRYSRHLNERRLNRMTLHIASQFENCEYISHDFETNQNKTTPLHEFARKIFYKIACNLYTPLYQLQLLQRNIGRTAKTSLCTGRTPEADDARDRTSAAAASDPIAKSMNENKFFRRKSL